MSFRWGIIGCGLIAPTFFQGLEKTGEGQVVAVASKSLRRAKKLQQKLNVPAAYASYAEMLERENLDAVYIANTHAEHARAALQCFHHGVPALIEKAFARNAEEAESVIVAARAKNLFCMEAMWTRFNPATIEMLRRVEAGEIGQVQCLKASFCTKMKPSIKTMPWNRMVSAKLAGGALLDLGVYPITLARMLFGSEPERITGSANMTWTGVDKTSEYHFNYSDGRRADLITSFVEERPRDAIVTGTKGIIRMPHFLGADHFVVTRPGRAPETVTCEPPGFGHEIREMHRCLREGLSESPFAPLDETLEIMRTMDTLRTQWGMKYPGE